MNEYALDLKTLLDLNNTRFYPDLFGVCNGRLISQFPFEYEDELWELTESLDDKEKKEVRLKFQILKRKKCLFPKWRLYNLDDSWSINALTQHTIDPFHAIITEDEINCNQLLNPNVMSSDDDLFKARRSINIERDADQISAFAEKLLWMSKKILFIDPYFRGSEKEKNIVLEKLLRTIHKSEIEIDNRVIEYHVDGEKIPTTFKQILIKNVMPFIPSGMKITFKIRPTNEMHNRFILTSEGGIHLGQGLMEPTPMQPSKDNINFLGFEDWQDTYRSHRTGTILETIELK